MSRDAQRLNDYLAHIAEAVDRISAYTAGLTERAFRDSPLIQDAVIRTAISDMRAPTSNR